MANKTPQMEHRVFTAPVEVRAAGEDGSIPMVGSPILFNVRTEIYPGFYEEIADGAVDEALRRGDDTRLLINHDPSLLLARTVAGTLRLSADYTQTTADADMAPTSYAKDLALSMARGDITQMSFAFQAEADEWSYLPNDDILRRVTQVRLFDVSVVTYPAYADTEASLRSAEIFHAKVAEMRHAGPSYSRNVKRKKFILLGG